MDVLDQLQVRRPRRFPLLDSDLNVLSIPALSSELKRVYETREWVYDLLREQAGSGMIRGRRPVLTGTLAGMPVVVKRLYHGGSTARLWKDRFLSDRRVKSSLEAARHLEERGILTPRLLFLSWRRSNGFVRAELGFERIFGRDADHYFFGEEQPPSDWSVRAQQISRLVKRLHDGHFEHGDLNLMNLFFSNSGNLYVLDLDKTELHRKQLDRAARNRNLARLERSVRKQGRLHGRRPELVESIVESIRG